jgi:hypothetical protein
LLGIRSDDTSELGFSSSDVAEGFVDTRYDET